MINLKTYPSLPGFFELKTKEIAFIFCVNTKIRCSEMDELNSKNYKMYIVPGLVFDLFNHKVCDKMKTQYLKVTFSSGKNPFL